MDLALKIKSICHQSWAKNHRLKISALGILILRSIRIKNLGQVRSKDIFARSAFTKY